MKKKWVQVKGRFRKNMVVFLGVMVVFCAAGVVQAAQQPQLPGADPGRFPEVAGSNGSIVRDNTTGLEWQRCPYGQSWTGSGCSGAAWEGNWEDAMRITAPGGFRVPTIDELKTLYPYDKNIFPSHPLDWFWSSSSLDNDRSYKWFISFYNGQVGALYKGSKGYSSQLRLVRVGQ